MTQVNEANSANEANNQPEPFLIANRWLTPDGTVLHSKHRHDFVQHEDQITGKTYAVDGGTDYVRLVGDYTDLTDMCVYSNSCFDLVRECAVFSMYNFNLGRYERTALRDIPEELIINAIAAQKLDENWLTILQKELELRNQVGNVKTYI